MKHIFTICLLLYGLQLSGQNQFYYSWDNKILLTEVPDQYVIQLKDEKVRSKNSLLTNIDVIKNINNSILLARIQDNHEILKLISDSDIISVRKAYKFGNDPLYPTNEIILKPINNLYHEELIKLLQQYEVEITTKKRLFSIVSCKKEEDVLLLANKLYETKLFEYCYPNFYMNVTKYDVFPSDPFFSRQFYLHNTGQEIIDGRPGTSGADINAPEAWDISMGDPSIVIAVIDEGVTANHPDLPNSRQVRLPNSNMTAYYTATDFNDPSPQHNGNHGNACAGIIAASHNNEGISGIAPACKIMPISIMWYGMNAAHYTTAIEFAVDNGADIISCSWGYSSPSPGIEAAITDAIQNGRNGQGCIVVFAGGNFLNNHPAPGFPSNANIDGLICVGASTRDDTQAEYNPNGAALDIVAPSHRAYDCQISGESYEVWTMDIPGAAGYNEWHDLDATTDCDNVEGGVGERIPNSGTNFLSYTGRFGGTSASCPMVAGVAALMLSHNPCLTALEVEAILKSSADKVGGFNYNHNTSKPGHSNEMGFGRLNAFSALRDPRFIQNVTLSGTHRVKSSGVLSAGFNVTSTIPTGNVNILTGSDVIFKAIDEIILDYGFETANGSTFTAEIFENTNNCNNWSSFKNDPFSFNPIIDKQDNKNIAPNKEVSNDNNILAYPNPFTGNIKITFTQYNGRVKLSLYDCFGRTFFLDQKESAKTNMPINFDFSYLKPGIYYLKVASVDNENEIFTHVKIIKH